MIPNKYTFTSLRKKKRRRYLTYLFLMIVTLFIFTIVFAGKKEEADVAVKDIEHKLLGKDIFKHITETDIKKYDLTIDWDLQSYVSETAKKYKIGFGAVVVMDADDGDIISMWGKDRSGEDCSIPLNSYLAASIFKIVTASAAIEQGMTPESTVSYSGNPWTIYKGQLKDSTDKWTQYITFAHAFAQSNNVVFAKLGMSLGEEPLFLNAMRYGFWKPPMRECWSAPSTVMIPETEYDLGELACGLNHTTRMSPVHAAQIVTPALNKGLMVSPRIVRSMPVEKAPAIDEQIADDIYSMMGGTIKSGTFSRRFRMCTTDRILKEVTIGAKSGSIDSKNPDGRLTWFVGYADHPTKGKITIVSLLLRDPYYWIKADEFARMIIRQYYDRPSQIASAPAVRSVN
ncbi:MAG TPA: penicillin-binding transpeptidase domain-containing protein [Desulfomonilia bacterium]